MFDLDNTLYPAASNLFARVSVRITQWIRDHFDLDHDGARALQRKMFLEYGTSLRGLMVEHGVEPARFLDYVHDIDVTDMPRNTELDRLLTALPGRKVIFTNGSVPHAERIIRQIGIEPHFEGVFDIVASDYIPKPDPRPYEAMVARFGIDPRRAVMVEDMAKNLVPAHAMGMTTVWLRHDAEWSGPAGPTEHVHHVTDDLMTWLGGVVQPGARPA